MSFTSLIRQWFQYKSNKTLALAICASTMKLSSAVILRFSAKLRLRVI